MSFVQTYGVNFFMLHVLGSAPVTCNCEGKCSTSCSPSKAAKAEAEAAPAAGGEDGGDKKKEE